MDQLLPWTFHSMQLLPRPSYAVQPLPPMPFHRATSYQGCCRTSCYQSPHIEASYYQGPLTMTCYLPSSSHINQLLSSVLLLSRPFIQTSYYKGPLTGQLLFRFSHECQPLQKPVKSSY